MNSCPVQRSDCSTCPGHMVCRCLQVTEEVLLTAMSNFELRTLKEVRQHTGAGDGCTACHRIIRQYLERQPQQAAPLAA